MARYTGPKVKIARRFLEPIFGYSKSFEKKKYPPGQHGNSKRRKKQSEYGLQLTEKQKAKYTYGILERQFRKMYKNASRKKGITGEILLQLAESRLDNVIYRMGISPSRAGARQLVSHRHVVVNGSVVNIPSYEVKVGDVVGVRERSKSMEIITESLLTRKNQCSWIEWDDDKFAGKFMQVPTREQIPENINEQLIVELYSK